MTGISFKNSPILVESTAAVFAKMLSPNGFQGTKTMRGIDIADNSDTHHWGCFDDGNGFYDLLLVDFYVAKSKYKPRIRFDTAKDNYYN